MGGCVGDHESCSDGAVVAGIDRTTWLRLHLSTSHDPGKCTIIVNGNLGLQILRGREMESWRKRKAGCLSDGFHSRSPRYRRASRHHIFHATELLRSFPTQPMSPLINIVHIHLCSNINTCLMYYSTTVDRDNPRTYES
jgi:hypothetical protein